MLDSTDLLVVGFKACNDDTRRVVALAKKQRKKKTKLIIVEMIAISFLREQCLRVAPWLNRKTTFFERCLHSSLKKIKKKPKRHTFYFAKLNTTTGVEVRNVKSSPKCTGLPRTEKESENLWAA